MLCKRVVPCLDVREGRVVKGVHFQGLRDAGDPVELAKRYDGEGADELVFLDISASLEGRQTMREVAGAVAAQVFIPFTVGGGIRTAQDVQELLQAGADKVSLNTSAIENPGLVAEAARLFGSQCVVVAIDAKRRPDGAWDVCTHGGTRTTGLEAVEWAHRAEELGAGEILLTSMDRDGTNSGYDLELTAAVSETVGIPVIASGGAGELDHLYQAATTGKADAVLVASLFHYGRYRVRDAKEYLAAKGVPIRW